MLDDRPMFGDGPLPYHVGIENSETIMIVKRCVQLDNHITCHKLLDSSS
jgi:hypothetical protein